MRTASRLRPVRTRCRSALHIRGYAPFDVADMELPAPSAANLELPAPADVLNSVSAALAVNNSVSAALSEGDAADNSISAAFDALRPHATPNRRRSFNTDMPATTICGKRRQQRTRRRPNSGPPPVHHSDQIQKAAGTRHAPPGTPRARRPLTAPARRKPRWWTPGCPARSRGSRGRRRSRPRGRPCSRCQTP